jgi:two-component system sensor kinase FixL
MNIQAKLLVFMATMLLLLLVVTVSIGTWVINTIIYGLNTELLALKLATRIEKIERTATLIEDSGATGIAAYVRQAQTEMLQQFQESQAAQTERYYIITGQDRQSLLQPDATISADMLKRMFETKSGTTTFRDQGVTYFTVYRYFETWDWLLGVSLPKATMFQQRQIYFTTVSSFSLIVFIGVLILAYVIGKRLIVNPLAMLVTVTKAIATGNFDQALQLPQRDEIGQLADAIHRMAQQLRQNFEQIAAQFATIQCDMAERQQAAAALSEKHALLQQLIDSTPDHIYAKDVENRFLIANQPLIHALGAQCLEEVVGKTDYDFHSSERVQKFYQEERRVLESGQPLINREDCIVDRVTGAKIWMLTTKAVLRDQQGNIMGLVGFNRDITEHRLAEEAIRTLNVELEQRVHQRTAELETANNELQNFAYVVSHDLKAPLRAISRLVQWLVEDYATAFDDKGKELAVLLVGRVKRLDEMIDGILEYSRIGRMVRQTESVDLNGLLSEVIDLLAPPPAIRIEIAPELPTMVGDKIRIQQVFANLIGNAIKFIDKSQGEVAVGCADDGAFWRFSVTDNGPGIDPKYHEKIFQIFQTLQSRDDVESTGIGLSIVKKIVEFYGGKVWVESRTGKGSTFFFTFPKSGERP